MTSTSNPDRRMYLALFAIGIVVFGAAAASIPAPGYMDAEYYFATARQIAGGKGFVEPFVWNFLSAPSALPAASHTYWQPLASLLAAAAMAVLGVDFRVAQLVSVLFASTVPLLSARIAISFGGGRREAWLAGAFGLLPGFFAPYMLTTDTFALFAVIGGLLLWQVGEVASHPTAGRWVMLGGLVALGSLARADGLLLWIPVVYALAAARSRRFRPMALVLAGFGALMAPWWVRNVMVSGALVSPGAARALWLLDYDELFSFPAAQLTFARWWAAGLGELLMHRLVAVAANIQTVVAVNGSILLLPMMVVGAWNQRRHPTVRAGLLYAGVLFLFMSLVFPFAGPRGGFFHSSAALLPLLYALAASGLTFAAAWVAPRLGWDTGRTRVMLTVVSILLAASLSLWAIAGKAGAFGSAASFGRNLATYAAAGEVLRQHGESPAVVGVVDPPGFYLATGWSGVALPHGTEQALQQVISAYEVEWLILEADHPGGLDALYRTPAARPWLAAPLRLQDPGGRMVYLYRVLSEGG